MNFLPENIQAYAEQFTSSPSAVLEALERETREKVLYPQMISGKIAGRIQSFISRILNPKFILEVGTYTGYSALCMAEGLAAGGKLVTIELNAEVTEIAKRYFALAGFSDRIEQVTGEAMPYISALKTPPDLVFLDADKENYPHYFGALLSMMKSGGIILADNVLWSGKVLDPAENDKETEGLRKFNAIVKAEKAVEHILLPVRDGIMMIRKK